MMLLAVLGGTVLPANGPLVYLGKISYGLYVFHPLGLLIARAIDPYKATRGSFGSFLIQDGIALLTTIALATTSYYMLESPFLSLKQRFTRVRSRQ